MRVFGILGGSDEDAVNLATRLLPELAARGIKVSVVARRDGELRVDQPGKDSDRHREAGAHEVLVLSDQRWALIHQDRSEAPSRLDDLVARLAPVDLVLALGFADGDCSRLEICRAPVTPRNDDQRTVAFAVEGEPGARTDGELPVMDLENARAIADFVIDHCRLGSV